jgi:hypothetical protein
VDSRVMLWIAGPCCVGLRPCIPDASHLVLVLLSLCRSARATRQERQGPNTNGHNGYIRQGPNTKALQRVERINSFAREREASYSSIASYGIASFMDPSDIAPEVDQAAHPIARALSSPGARAITVGGGAGGRTAVDSRCVVSRGVCVWAAAMRVFLSMCLLPNLRSHFLGSLFRALFAFRSTICYAFRSAVRPPSMVRVAWERAVQFATPLSTHTIIARR